jgi:hypothetical protein
VRAGNLIHDSFALFPEGTAYRSRQEDDSARSGAGTSRFRRLSGAADSGFDSLTAIRPCAFSRGAQTGRSGWLLR